MVTEIYLCYIVLKQEANKICKVTSEQLVIKFRRPDCVKRT